MSEATIAGLTFRSREADGLHCSATFSDDDAYRYDLCWRWAPGPVLVAWMLNPSTATHEKLDRTVEGLLNRARKNTYLGRNGVLISVGGVRVINLFAYRATDPADMKRAADPVGPMNDQIIAGALSDAGRDGSPVVVGWGKHGSFMDRDTAALDLLMRSEPPPRRLLAFKVNADGSPQHPLYVAHAAEPFTWWERPRLGA